MTAMPALLRWARPAVVVLAGLLMASVLAGCGSAAQNVAFYHMQRMLGVAPGMAPRLDAPPGTVEGRVLAGGQPLAGATVVAAESDGAPHVAVTDAEGRYRLEGLPPGWYAVAAVAPGMAEGAIRTDDGLWVGHVDSDATLAAPPLVLHPHAAPPLAAPEDVEITASAVVTTVYPAGAAALRSDGRFMRDGVLVDSLRFFRPLPGLQGQPAEPGPLLLLVYPSFVDGWQDVSVALASQGLAVAALSPMEARGVDMDAHAQDARVALALAREWCAQEGLCTDESPVVVLAGSFSSVIAWRLLRDEGAAVDAWITVGGITNAFAGAADYYAGRIQLPPWHADAVPALGPPSLAAEEFLRNSPVYDAADLPPTLIIHTAADEVTPISQALEMEAALRAAGVPVEAFYYEDTTHYLQIGADMTDAGRLMFERILAFIGQHGD